MSDFLTNLVSRSFSSLAPVQRGTASLTAAPEAFENSLEKFSDPFTEAENSSKEDVALSQDRDQSKSLENTRGNPDAISPLQRDDAAAFAKLHGRSNQPESYATPKQARRKPGTIAPPIIEVSLPSSVGDPLPETSGASAVDSGTLQGKAFQTLQRSSGIAPLIKSVPEGNIHRSTLLAKQFDSDSSPQKPGQLSPQSLAPLMPGSAAGDWSQRPGLSESVAASDASQVSNAPSAIIPKVEPPLSITVIRGPNAGSGQVPFETAAQPPFTETIVNVAIGRIEVRATSMESPKREQQAKGPRVMNLDDYMQQRSRGNR